MPTDPLPFRDLTLDLRKRVDDLLGRLTLDERLAMLHQFTPAVPRLGLAAFRTGQEALHGVAWMGGATVFPQAVGLGATWDPELVRRIGEVVGEEIRAMRVGDDRVGLNVWSPTVNLLRHPLWGRNEEGYAEDPRLTAALATAYTRGLRGDHPHYWRTAPVLKHWLAHNHETDRDTASSSVRPRVLHEYELPAFRGPVTAGAVAGVMPAYNLVNGRPNHLSPLLSRELRRWSDRELVVCSDAGAPSNLVVSEEYFDTHEEASAAALRAGVDSFTDLGEDSASVIQRFRGALDRGLIDTGDVDRAVRRLLTMRFLLGEFDGAADPHRRTAEAPGAHDTAEHRALAQEAAESAIVLLKNDGLLPLGPDVGRIAVVGPLADACKLDWYSGSLLHRSSPVDGLRERFGRDRVTFAEGVDRVRLRCAAGWVRVPAADPELTRRDDDTRSAAAVDPAQLRGRTDLPPLSVVPLDQEPTVLDLLDWGDGVLTLRAPDGRYLSVADDGRLRASASEPGGWVVQEIFRWEECAHGEGHLLRHLGTGRYVSVAADGLKVAEPPADEGGDGATGGAATAGGPFVVEVVERGEDSVAEAAAEADVVIVVAGNDPYINGRETQDRTTLALPPQQERLWRAAHRVNPRTALVLTSSYPYAVGEADRTLPALLWTAHGGQAAGTALARVLAGEVSPGGRLPQTWYADDAHLPDLFDYDIIGSRATYLYFDGTPLYPFGHGLSYVPFAYGELSVERRDDDAPATAGGAQRPDGPGGSDGSGGTGGPGGSLVARLTVTNTGAMTADEVVQLYVREVEPRLCRPHRWLAGHRRLRLAPGATETVTLTLPLTETLGHWDVAHGRWTVPPGRYELQAGASSQDLRRTASFTVDGPEPEPRALLAAPVAAGGAADLAGATAPAGPVAPGGATASAGPAPSARPASSDRSHARPGHWLYAADFDAQRATRLVDLTRTHGDAVANAGGAPGQLLFRDCDFGPGATAVTVEAALAGSGLATVELHLADGTPLAVLTVPTTGDRYAYTTVTGALGGSPTGVHDLRVTLRGALRLARLGFSA